MGGFVLLLETEGRKSGLPRITPLQYDKVEGIFYVASARGVKADWFQNLVKNPCVRLTVGCRKFNGVAEAIIDPVQIAEILELRLQLHPKLIGTILRLEGVGPKPTREQLLRYAENRALAKIRPIEDI